MPGYADLFDDDKLFNRSIAMPIAMPIAMGFSSAERIKLAGVDGIATHLRENKIRFQPRAIERIVAWSATAVEPTPLLGMLSEHWKQLNDLRVMLSSQIVTVEQEMAKFLVRTP